ncbi:MAG: GlsB/YeaQ/YmgE family stress response membrane protein [Betaproteobacteria bacterium]|nr:GlsB/YeaQ/YmgE family stress response membrane protein [Betaproteobacteria bacterium]
MLHLLGTLVVGLIVGLIARAVLPGKNSMGWIMTMVLGIAGSFAARFVGQAMGWYSEGQPAGWIASIVGALVLLVIYERIVKSQAGGSGS